MNDWMLLLFASAVGSVVSLSGGVYLLYARRGAKKLQKYAVPFAAGALLAAVFLDLLPEAFAHGDAKSVSVAVLVAFLAFFFLERGLSWFHHHHEHKDDKSHKDTRRTASLIVIGDTLHNFIDGLAIGSAFLVSPAVGLVTTLAVAAHEIPQEIGDFGLLLARGMKKKQIIIVNLVSALMTVVGAVLVYGFGGHIQIPESILLGVIAGFFIYIAASDIVPTIHQDTNRRSANFQSLVLLFGVIFVGIVATVAHSYVAHGGHEGEAHEAGRVHEEKSVDMHNYEDHDDDHDHDHNEHNH